MSDRRFLTCSGFLSLFLFTWFVLIPGFIQSQEEGPLAKAQKLYEDGDYEGSITVLNAFIDKLKTMAAQKKTISEAYYLLAKIFYEVGDEAKCHNCLGKVFETSPDFSINEKSTAFSLLAAKIKKDVETGGGVWLEEADSQSRSKSAKKKFPWLLVLGEVVALGVIVYLLTAKKKNADDNPPLTTFTLEFVTSWGSTGSGNGQFMDCKDIAVDNKGFCYVVDWDRNLQKFTTSGAFVAKWDIPGVHDVATDAAGNVYVTCNDYIRKYSSEGQLLKRWGEGGEGEGQFTVISGIAIFQDFCYVGDWFSQKIQKFDLNGTFISTFSQSKFTRCADLATDYSGNLYLVDKPAGLADPTFILKFTSAGTFVGRLSASEQIWAQAVAAYSNGDIYASGGGHILKFVNDRLVAKAGSTGSGNGQLDGALGIDIDSQGYLYTAETTNHRVQKFRIR